ncbi:epoxide hydrolase 4-like [Onthophagus taurus]|uniref:epoxide hydrolase 4-like n=1 Tax=Onthophagus taurus TaxID=166361 RepID=UPI000C202997|nr:epoxide hydrolase 4-like [Onthophagus taurus]
MSNIIHVSRWEHFCAYFFAIIVGVWIILKRFFTYIWNPNNFFNIRNRDTAPMWLVDNTFGQHKYVKLKKVKIHYVEAGLKQNHPIILLHGFPDCWISWRHQIHFLSEYFRVIAIDLKGFGDSDKPIWRGSYKIDVLLTELSQFLSVLNINKCTIIGHDIGGLIGWFLSYEKPDLVEKFVSISCPHPNVYWNNLPLNKIMNKNWINFAQLPSLPELDSMKEDLRIISDYHLHLQEKDNRHQEFIEAYKYAFSRKEDWSGPLNYFRNLPFVRINEKSNLLKVPTLLVTGNKDQHVNLEGVVKSTDYCDKFFVKIIESTGHFPHQENPDNFNKALAKFLKIKSGNNNKINERRFSPTTGLMNRMIGAMSTTVKYGNSVLDSVQKKTNGVVHIPSFSFGDSST